MFVAIPDTFANLYFLILQSKINFGQTYLKFPDQHQQTNTKFLSRFVKQVAAVNFVRIQSFVTTKKPCKSTIYKA